MKLTILVVAILGVVSLSSFKGEKASRKAAEKASVSIHGSIQDEITGELLAGVAVALEGTDLKTYTDFDGNFTFENLKEGSYKLKANLVSYKDVEVEKFNVKVAKKNKINLKMKKKN